MKTNAKKMIKNLQKKITKKIAKGIHCIPKKAVCTY